MTTPFDCRKLNLIRDPLDPRDHDDRMMFARAPHIPAHSSYNDVSLVGSVVDQGETGSCVGQTFKALCRFLFRSRVPGIGTEFSARWIWLIAKDIDRKAQSVVFENAGTYARNALKVLNKFGACPEYLWPFNELLPSADLESAIIGAAAQYRIGEYWRLKNLKAQRMHLATVGPFPLGVPVYENWEEIGSDGIVPLPSGALLGGHEVLATGHDDPTELIEAKNSWGLKSGKRGYIYLPYEYVEEHAWDAWGVGVPQ